MPETRRSIEELLILLADNTTGQISPQDVRDMFMSLANPFGSIHVDVSIETVIANADEWTKVLGTTAAGHLRDFDMPSDGRIRYTGEAPVHVHVASSFTLETASNNQVIGIRIVKSGDAEDPDSKASAVRLKLASAGGIESTAIHFDSVMENGDYLELFVENETSASNVTLGQIYFFAVGMIL